MELVGIISGVVAAIVAIIAYLWPRTRNPAPNDGQPSLPPPVREHADVLDRVLSTKTLRVGFFRYPPLVDYIEEDGAVAPAGLYGEMLKWIAHRNALALLCTPLNIGDVVDATERDDVDMILCVFQTPERSKRVDFTAILHSVKVGGITLEAQTRIRSVADLHDDDVRIVVCDGEIGHELIRTLGIPKRRLKILDTHEIPEIASLVESGRADVAIADFLSLSQYLHAHGDRRPRMKLVFRRDPVTVCQNGVMVARGQSKWADWLDEKFRVAREQEEIAQLEKSILEEFKNIIQRY